MTIKEIWPIILQIGSVSGLISLIYVIGQNVKKKKRFSFVFRGSAGGVTEKDNLEFYNLSFDGHIKNQSLEPNSIIEISYVIWDNGSRTRSLTNGIGAEVHDGNQNKISLPILFSPYEGKHLKINFQICLTGTHVKALVYSKKPVQPGAAFYIPKHEFHLLFTDINGNLFDEKGALRSQKLIDLWWTLPNTFERLKSGNPFPYLWHMVKIINYYLILQLRKFFRFFGF
ncbi:MAG: hypothetical protein P4L74_06535 [Candidatus Doudnabacteria bacterium]|nr:hypothetical protein [Candidatus Doudnabacteria bacterium]